MKLALIETKSGLLISGTKGEKVHYMKAVQFQNLVSEGYTFAAGILETTAEEVAHIDGELTTWLEKAFGVFSA